MSYAMRGIDGFDGLGVDVSVTDPMTGSVLIEHPTTEEPECGSALALQQMLADLGYYKAPIDGLFTIETFASLQHFCLDIGVPYLPGTYPGPVQCSGVLGAWQNKQATVGPYPSPGHPAVMPGITPADRMAGVRAAAAAAEKDCAPCKTLPPAVSGLWGFGRALGALAFGAVFDPTAQITIRLNSSGAPVVLWQTGLGITPADGKFGPATQKATIAWQKANGLTGDGVVGQQSWAKLAQLMIAQIPGTVPVGTTIPIPTGPASPPSAPGTPGTTPSGTSPTPTDPGTSPPAPSTNPVERAQAWWASQPKPTQYAVMGGSAMVVVGLLAVVAGGGKKKPAAAHPNRRRLRN